MRIASLLVARYGIIISVSRANEPRFKWATSIRGKHGKIERAIELVDCNVGNVSFRFWDSERPTTSSFDGTKTVPEIKFIEPSCNRSYCSNEARRVTKPPRDESQCSFFDKLQAAQREFLIATCNRLVTQWIAQQSLDVEEDQYFRRMYFS